MTCAADFEELFDGELSANRGAAEDEADVVQPAERRRESLAEGKRAWVLGQRLFFGCYTWVASWGKRPDTSE